MMAVSNNILSSVVILLGGQPAKLYTPLLQKVYLSIHPLYASPNVSWHVSIAVRSTSPGLTAWVQISILPLVRYGT